MSKGEISFTIFKEEDLKKMSLCAVTHCSFHLETTHVQVPADSL